MTHPVTYGSETGGVDLLKGKTAVSKYFTSTPATANATSSSTTSVPARSGSSGSQTSAAKQPTSSTHPAATTSTGGAGTMKISGPLGVGMLGVAWLL